MINVEYNINESFIELIKLRTKHRHCLRFLDLKCGAGYKDGLAVFRVYLEFGDTADVPDKAAVINDIKDLFITAELINPSEKITKRQCSYTIKIESDELKME